MKKITTIITTFSLFCLNTGVVLADKGLGTITGAGGYVPEDLTSTEVSGASNMLSTIFSNSIGFMTIVSGIFFLFHFVTGALNWVTSGGESKNLEDARRKMTNGAIGMAITIGSYSIIYIIGQVLGFDILKIGDQVAKLGPGGTN